MSSSKDVLLSEIVNVDLFLDMIKQRYVLERSHPSEPNLKIFTYSRSTQFQGMWNEATILARGLILDTHGDSTLQQATIVARGLSKFFTMEQSATVQGALQLIDDDENYVVESTINPDSSTPVIVSEKLDGSLGVMYVLHGKAQLASKGSFKSDIANKGNKNLADSIDVDALGNFLTHKYAGKTAIFEMLADDEIHVVQYEHRNENVFLGFIDNSTGVWDPAENHKDFASIFGFSIPKVYPATTLADALSLPYDFNHEGIVIATIPHGDAKQNLYKVKYDEFYELRQVRYNYGEHSRTEVLLKELSYEQFENINSGEDLNEYHCVMSTPSLQPLADLIVSKIQEQYYRETIVPLQRDIEPIITQVSFVLDQFGELSKDKAREFAEFIENENYSEELKRNLYAAKAAIVRGQDWRGNLLRKCLNQLKK